MSGYELAGIEKSSPYLRGEAPLPDAFVLPESTAQRLQGVLEKGKRADIQQAIEEEVGDEWVTQNLCNFEQLLARNPYAPILVPSLVAQGLVEQFPASQDFRNLFTEKVAYLGAGYFRRSLPRSMGQLDAMIEGAAYQLARMQPNESLRNSAFRSVVMMGSEIKSAYTFKSSLDSYDIRYREQKDLALLRIENDGLFEHTRFLQKYQLKPALVKATGAGNIQDWMVIDWGATKQDLAEKGVVSDTSLLDDTPGALARVFGTRHQFIADKPVFEMHGTPEYATIKVNFSDSIKGTGDGSTTPDLGLQLMSDGHLVGLRGISLQQYAERLGLSDQYELLRGEILAIYSDLVLPAHLVKEATDLEREVLPTGPGKPRAVSTIRRLILARTKLINSDQARVEKEVKLEHRKRPGDHPVIGFIRPLPKGYRASFEARELCRLYLKKELAPEGETFVKPHRRGGDESIAGHRAIRRVVGGAVIYHAREDA